MFKKLIKFLGATALLGIVVFTLSYIYVLNGTITNLRDSLMADKTRGRKFTNTIVGDSGKEYSYQEEVCYKDTLYNVSYSVVNLPKYAPYYGQKAYENYSAITNTYSKQYKLQEKAVTDEFGFRKYDERYLIAIGTYFKAPVGTYIDVELANGVVIPCIVGDIKADVDTDDNNVYSLSCGCATEFIVDGWKIDPYTKGDVSSVFEEWESPCVDIVIYEYNYFDDNK